jgi:hypothetical protein
MSTFPVGLNHALFHPGPALSTLSPMVTSDRHPTASHLAICPANANVTPHAIACSNVTTPHKSHVNIESIASVKSNQKRILDDQELPCSKHKRLNQTPSPNPLHQARNLGEPHTLNLITPEPTLIVLNSDDDALSHAGKETFDSNCIFY